MSIVHKSEILLPAAADLNKWAVVACDQFTSQTEYWEDLDAYVGENLSALRLIYPEIYLNCDQAARIESIRRNMREYLENGVFRALDSFILTERTVAGGKKRKALVATVDLEAYDYRRVLCGIRATEDTILDRLPVRLKIREDAQLELPHIILLYDDADKAIIEPLYERRGDFKKLYDFELNMHGGHLIGYEVPDSEDLIAKFDALTQSQRQIEKYGFDAGIGFAVGDGNHSMATAKAHWDKIKQCLSGEERENNPARFCLVELMNIYDEGLIFEPIHRLITKYPADFIEKLACRLEGNGKLTLLTAEGDIEISCPDNAAVTIKAVQEYIEERKDETEVDYIHGERHTRKTVADTQGLGILMPEFLREDLFNYVLNVGNLPKKAFSIGTAENKKYYLEAKRINK